MLVVDFIELKLKDYQKSRSFDLKKATWEVLSKLKEEHDILYKDRTLDMQPEELDKVMDCILKTVIKIGR